MDEWGGAQVHVRDLALWMKAQDFEPVIISGMPGAASDAIKQAGLEYIEIPSLQREISPIDDLKAVKELRDILPGLRLDLLTCHSSKAGLVGRIAARSLGLPVIFTAHNWTFGEGVSKKLRPLYWALEWIGGLLGDHIITVSEHGRQQALKAKIASPSKITTINNGMPDRAAREHTPQTPTRLTMVARIGWPKDHELLIKALARCKDLDWTLDFIGGGENDWLKSLPAKAGMEDRIHFLGERNDVADRLENHTDIFCLISQWEGFPLSTLEAMRASLPVIVSDAGGSREAVTHGKTGYIVPVGDGKTLIKILRDLIPDREKQKTFGAAGRASFEKNFTFDIMAEKTLGVYRKVLAEGSS